MSYRLSCLLFILCYSYTNAQTIFDSNPGEKTINTRFGASFQIGISLINPSEVNKHISNYVNSQVGGGIILTNTGSSTIDKSINLNFSPTIKFKKYVLRCMADLGIASRSITINLNERRFTTLRFSPGILLDRYFNIDNGKQFFVGAGIQHHFMSFENTPASGIGGRIESGIRLKALDDTMYSFYMMYDFANQNTSTTIPSRVQSIDFSGIGIGARIEF